MALKTLYAGLDTVSGAELRELTYRWTGELSMVDSTSYDAVISPQNLDQTIEKWYEARMMAREVSAEHMFGSQSELMLEQDSCAMQLGDAVAATSEVATTMWAEWLFNGLVVVAMAAYLYSIYRYYADVVAMFSSVFHSNVIASHRVSERRQSDIFYGFLGKLLLVGVLFVGLLATGFVLRMGLTQWSDTLTKALMLPAIAVAAFVAVACVQNLFLLSVGYVTRSMSMARALMQVRSVYFVFATVLVAPMLMMAQMRWGGIYLGWLIVAGVMALVTIGFYLKESFELFTNKKVSILHWILYLCTVEVLPLSFLWQILSGKLGSNL